jgi:hypothetical protein
VLVTSRTRVPRRVHIASSANSPPTSYAVSSLNADANNVAFGDSATGRPLAEPNVGPRTKVGPSDSTTCASRIDSIGVSVNPDAPVSSRTFVSRSRAAMRSD